MFDKWIHWLIWATLDCVDHPMRSDTSDSLDYGYYHMSVYHRMYDNRYQKVKGG